MGAVWGDYNNDGYPDLYISKDKENALYRNNGNGTFTDVAASAGVVAPLVSFPCWFWDYNNDGNLDIFASATSGPIEVLALHPFGIGKSTSNDRSTRFLQEKLPIEGDRLYRGDGQGNFADVTQIENVTYPSEPMGANFGDLDNDGWLDFHLATGDVPYAEIRPNVMFVYRPGHGFVNVTMAGGFGHLQKGHGVSFADIDNDGDQDVYVQMGGAYPADKFNDALFENPGFGHHWITLKLIGTRTNRAALGARVHVQVRDGNERRSIYRHVTSGGSFGCNPLRVQVGLGKATRIDKIEIDWPVSNRRQVFKDVPMDQFIQVVEGENKYTRLDWTTVRLGMR